MERSANEKVAAWIKRRAERDYPEDVSLVLLYGSFVNGTANSRSDVDCYFIPKTGRGREFAADFIIGGVGYDIFSMSWERVEALAGLDGALLPCLGDAEIVFSASDEDAARFRALQNRLRDSLADENTAKTAARDRFDFACRACSGLSGCGSLSEARLLAGYAAMSLADAAAIYGGEYFHYGLKRQLSDLRSMSRVPAEAADEYLGIVKSRDIAGTAGHCLKMRDAVSAYTGFGVTRGEAPQRSAERSDDYQALAALYEEIISTFNKIYVCCESGNFVLAFLSAVCLQNELEEAAGAYGFARPALLDVFVYDDLRPLEAAARAAQKELAALITENGGKIKSFDTFEEFERAGL